VWGVKQRGNPMKIFSTQRERDIMTQVPSSKIRPFKSFCRSENGEMQKGLRASGHPYILW